MNTIVLGTMNQSEIGVMFTNLAIPKGGPTLYLICVHMVLGLTIASHFVQPTPVDFG